MSDMLVYSCIFMKGYPLDTGPKLNVCKRFRRRILYKFDLCPVSTGVTTNETADDWSYMPEHIVNNNLIDT